MAPTAVVPMSGSGPSPSTSQQAPPQTAAAAPVHEAAITGAIVVSAIVALGFGVAAVATPNWHFTDSPSGHIRRGLFEVCTVESVDGVRDSFCQEHSMGPFCGHSIGDIRNRFIWPAALAVLSLALVLSIPLGATCSWFLYKPRPKTLLAVSFASLVTMLTGMTVHVHTLDSWYFCGKEFCRFARDELQLGGNELCLSGMGYSFMLALIYCGCLVVVMIACALYSRWLRLGVIHDAEALRKAAKRQQREREQREGGGGGRHPRGGSGDSNEPTAASAGPPTAGSGAGTGPGSGEGDDVVVDDWQFDEATGMHWSAYLGLYLDPRTNRFYDPHSDCWHDPDTDEWYRSPSRW